MPKLLRIILVLSAALTLVNCSRDPQVLKKKYLDSGNKYFERGKYKEAQIMYQKALHADPKYGEAYYQLAMTAFKLRQISNEVPSLRRAIELLKGKNEPEWRDASMKYAEIMLGQAQRSDVSDTQRAGIIDEESAITKELLAKYPNSYEGHKLAAEELYFEAVRQVRASEQVKARETLQKSIVEFRKTVSINPSDKESNMYLARALTFDDEIGEAEQIYKAQIERDPKDTDPYVELYRIYMSQRKVADGEALLKKAIAVKPDDNNFQTLLAAHYFNNGNRPEGVKVLDHMEQDLKDFPRAYFTAGDFYLRLRDTENAIKQFQEGERKDKSHKDEYEKYIISVLIQQGKTAQAYEENLQILKDNPKDPEAKALRAQFLLDKGDISEAINELQSVVTARPDNFVAHFQLGRAHYAKQEYAEATQEFEKAIKLRRDYMPPRLALVQVSLARGDNDTALKLAEEAVKLSPNNMSAKILESSAQMRKGDFKDSREGLEMILSKNPKQPDALLEMGVLNLMEKKYDDAAGQFQKAYEADPANLRGLLGESEAYLLKGKPDQAIQVIQAESDKYPNRNDLKRDLADINFRTGHFDEAIGLYKQLLASFKDNPRLQGDLYAKIGDVEIRKHDYPGAINDLQKAHQLAPDATPVMNALALLLDNEGKHAEARKLYEDSIAKRGDDPEALNNLAYLMVETGGNLDQALTLATRAKQKRPDLFEISDTIGWIYLKKNLADSAVDIFRELTSKVPDNPTYHLHYAMAFMQKGDRANAHKQAEEALKLTKSKEEEGQIRDLLNKTGA